MKSMTGYGQATCECGGVSLLVELTSLNSRYCDVQVKLPREMGFFEPRIIRCIKNKFARGKFYVKVSIEKTKGDEAFQLNMDKVHAYVNMLGILKETFELKDDVSLFLLGQFKHIWEVEDQQVAEVSFEQMEKVVAEAASELEKMRVKEGEETKEEILVRAHNVERMIEHIEHIFTQSNDIIKERLRKKAHNFLKETRIELNEVRLEQELFYYLERADIQEEISRLKNHIAQVKKVSISDTPVGRKLDFILQELNREANTISSKAFCAEIQNNVVSIKVELEKIREQVQNVE